MNMNLVISATTIIPIDVLLQVEIIYVIMTLIIST